MPDPLQDAIELVDQTISMPAHVGVQYLFDRYRVGSPEFREAIVMALSNALRVGREKEETFRRSTDGGR